MALREEFEKTGVWLFQRRSYLPLLLGILFLAALRNFKYPFHSHRLDELWEIICLGISLVGLGVRVLAIGYAAEGTSGRGTEAPSASTLNTTGMYSVLRHPLYLGNFLIWLGIVLSVRVWWFTGVSVLIYWLYYERIMFAEEEFLRRKFEAGYLAWADKTPAFLPRFKNWQKPNRPFSWKKVLRKEYSGLFAVIAVFSVLEVLEDWVVEKRLGIDRPWGVLFIAGLILYLALRTLKKKTNWLNESENS